MLTVGSLFAGIGGFDLGFERAGMRTVWQVEVDPFCRAVLAERFPLAKRAEDVVRAHARSRCSQPWVDFCPDCLFPVDVICGGFPCQSVSDNGHQRAAADERWLWPEFARIVRELRPRYVVVENVAALLGRGFREVVGDLAAAGYDAEWSCVRAADAGAPHRRERLFLVAYAERLGSQEGPRVFGRVDPEDLWQPDAWGSLSRRGSDGRLRRAPHPGVFGVADGFPTGLDGERLRAAGNALVPQIAEWIGRRILSYEADLIGGTPTPNA